MKTKLVRITEEAARILEERRKTIGASMTHSVSDAVVKMYGKTRRAKA